MIRPLVKPEKSKRGNVMGMLLVVGGLFLLLMFGIILAIGSATLNWGMDIITPELTNLGVLGDFNATHAGQVTINPVNTFIQNMTWVTGLVYMFGMMGIFGIAFVYRSTGDKYTIPLFFGLVVVLMIATIILSNTYEEFYTGTDDFTQVLQEHTMLSYLILYSPAIFAIVVFIAGIIMFSAPPQESFA